jgi:hypothetical protein
LLEQAGVMRWNFVEKTQAIANNQAVQENNAPDTAGNGFRHFRNNRAAEAVCHQDQALERSLHDVVHNRFCRLRVVDVLVYPFPMSRDGGSEGLMALALPMSYRAVPAGSVVP